MNSVQINCSLAFEVDVHFERPLSQAQYFVLAVKRKYLKINICSNDVDGEIYFKTDILIKIQSVQGTN
jgi:hypothetical protein